MAASKKAGEEFTEDEVSEHDDRKNQNGAVIPGQPGEPQNRLDETHRPEGDSNVAVAEQAEQGVGRNKKRGLGANDPMIAKLLNLREQRDKVKQEAKKLTREVKVENRKRTRLQKMAVKLSDNDLYSLLQQRGLPGGATSSQTASMPAKVTP
jgi:hypothetical protein